MYDSAQYGQIILPDVHIQALSVSAGFGAETCLSVTSTQIDEYGIFPRRIIQFSILSSRR